MTLFKDRNKQKSMLKWYGFKYQSTKISQENKRDKDPYEESL